ncbi:MAG: serine/threonine protein kinase, partial [Myxococcales bacterium]|nr:serine/threonine protein kinase [Myxococcales bacterium]
MSAPDHGETTRTVALDPPSSETDTLSAESRAGEPEALERYERIDRYVVLSRIGQGGMGAVYGAYDPLLRRRVALKVIRPHHADRDDGQARMLREARAMARLSHPNVLPVYDVGHFEGGVFIAMEQISGQTLRRWLAPGRPWAEALATLGQAGRGLEAAHAVGLVHRDFKPDNVLVGRDGRVRVLDFGLARPGVDADEDSVRSTDEFTVRGARESSGARRRIARLTEPGRVAGTLVYMSPEQLAAQPLDGRADQFSFCVVLYEALYGERPFDGRTRLMQMLELQRGLQALPAAASKVPRWLRAVVARGLSRVPDDRFESMEALLHELERSRGKVWKAGLLAAAVAGSVGGTALASAGPDPCQIDQTALGDAWSPAQREDLRAGFGAVEAVPPEAQMKVEERLDDWGQAWVASLRASCEATRIVGSQSEALLDLQGSCLERQRREATAIVERLSSPEAVGLAFELLAELPDVAVCADPRLEETAHPMPQDARRREAIMAAFEQLSGARGLVPLGRVDELGDAVRQLERTTADLEYLPLTLELRRLEADRLFAEGSIDAGVASLRASIREAEIAGLDELSATLRVQLADRIVGNWGPPLLQASALDEAEIALARLGRPEDRRHAVLRLARVAALENEGETEAALAEYRAIVDDARGRGDLRLAADAQRQLAALLGQLRRF